MKLSLARFPVFLSSRLPAFLVAATLLISQAAAQVALNPDPIGVVQIPDPNLKEAIREQLQLPAGTPITQQDMEKLEYLDNEKTEKMGITDLTGLEYATNLKGISLNQNEITDLNPLSNLIQLEALTAWGNPISDISPLAKLTNLKYIDLAGCDVADISPLANLTQLELLNLGWNHLIQDITPLANLTKLYHLKLTKNRILNISPLANLTELKELFIDGNRISDFNPLNGLSLTILERDQEPYTSCELPHLPIENRLQNRTFPSIFAPWAGADVKNLPELSETENLALHDLHWHGPYFTLDFHETDQGWRFAGILGDAQAIRDELLSLNPNMLFLVEVRLRDATISLDYPEDFPYWLRDANGNLVPTSPGSEYFLINFMMPGMQDRVVEQAIAAAQCGFYDGIFFDWFAEWGTVLPGYYSYEAEQQVKDKILQRIRTAVRDDFLIIINTNRSKIPRRAWGINGTFMETLPGNGTNGYTRKEIQRIENTLVWAEANLREPQVNCLEGWGIPTEAPDSPNNLRWMRVFTTMSLTLSDGYVLYVFGNLHQHIWYDFWDANLGRPIGPKAQPYQNIDGLFIREYTNGWAVYNRSGKPQPITLPRVSTGVASNKQDITHLLPDLDGEIYLRKGKPFDLNRDGTVNILDLILVSQHFGTTEGDINGDDTTDLLDLTLVAQQFN